MRKGGGGRRGRGGGKGYIRRRGGKKVKCVHVMPAVKMSVSEARRDGTTSRSRWSGPCCCSAPTEPGAPDPTPACCSLPSAPADAVCPASPLPLPPPASLCPPSPCPRSCSVPCPPTHLRPCPRQLACAPHLLYCGRGAGVNVGFRGVGDADAHLPHCIVACAVLEEGAKSSGVGGGNVCQNPGVRVQVLQGRSLVVAMPVRIPV